MAHRVPYRETGYARGRGRNGAFIPRVLEFAFSQHEDGTPLITIRVFSRRTADAPPVELTMTLHEWEHQALTIQLSANEQRRRWRQSNPGNGK